MSILFSMTPSNSERVYKLSEYGFLFDGLKNRLASAKQNYSKGLIQLMETMISMSPPSRPSLKKSITECKGLMKRLKSKDNKEFIATKSSVNFNPPSVKQSVSSPSRFLNLAKNYEEGFNYISPSKKNLFNNESFYTSNSPLKMSNNLSQIIDDSNILMTNVSPGKKRVGFFEKLKKKNNKKLVINTAKVGDDESGFNESGERNSPYYDFSQNFSKMKLNKTKMEEKQKKRAEQHKIKFNELKEYLEKKILYDKKGLYKENIVEKIYQDNSRYVGMMESRKRHGQGILYYSHGEIYGKIIKKVFYYLKKQSFT